MLFIILYITIGEKIGVNIRLDHSLAEMTIGPKIIATEEGFVNIFTENTAN